ncbi:YceI family protein [Arenibacter algicola]|uniref:YceI family protein n=1 Tax=Arenibacter algicola TaxID=616991 RepID=UPI0004DF7B45|nr:YceI family protein [Arenibacter algicola]|tara:strand:- start:2004 stop:2549 length:546 start_codon:yes stop_codon:yes gene_type:complete
MKEIYIIIINLLLLNCVSAQGKFLTKDGYVSFFSHSVVEDIKADNNQVLSIVDSETGEIAIQLLMRSFMFKKALMQEHFNENYVESYKYPKATFSGKIMKFNELEELEGETQIVGILTVHGREKEISARVNVEINKDEIILIGDFYVEVADFDIKIPAIVANNIAKTIKVNFELRHKPYKM